MAKDIAMPLNTAATAAREFWGVFMGPNKKAMAILMGGFAMFFIPRLVVD
jgi:uncharacterized phage infection (PIP) family protein YhgE